jgi:hypothetical protein
MNSILHVVLISYVLMPCRFNITYAKQLMYQITETIEQVLIEKPIVPQPAKNFPVFYGT